MGRLHVRCGCSNAALAFIAVPLATLALLRRGQSRHQHLGRRRCIPGLPCASSLGWPPGSCGGWSPAIPASGYQRPQPPEAVAAFYLGRLVVFLAEGPAGPTFVTYFGSAVTTLVTMVLLVVVSFSMAALSTEQQTRALRMVARQDELTGLLNRKAFIELAAEQLDRAGSHPRTGALILADLDHFKTVNDTYGHAAGDLALQAFADACTGHGPLHGSCGEVRRGGVHSPHSGGHRGPR